MRCTYVYHTHSSSSLPQAKHFRSCISLPPQGDPLNTKTREFANNQHTLFGLKLEPLSESFRAKNKLRSSSSVYLCLRCSSCRTKLPHSLNIFCDLLRPCRLFHRVLCVCVCVNFVPDCEAVGIDNHSQTIASVLHHIHLESTRKRCQPYAVKVASSAEQRLHSTVRRASVVEFLVLQLLHPIVRNSSSGSEIRWNKSAASELWACHLCGRPLSEAIRSIRRGFIVFNDAAAPSFGASQSR